MTASAAVSDLRAAFIALAAKPTALSQSDCLMLRGRVRAAVDEMKAAGSLPERVVVAVKGLAIETGMNWDDRKLYEQLVDWCVERYYGDDEP